MSGIFSAIGAVVGAGASIYSSRQKAKASQQGASAQTEAGTLDIETMTPQQRAQLDSLLGTLTGRISTPNQRFTKEQAILDATYVAQRASEDVLKQVPQIVTQAGAGGAYSSTGVQALVNDVAQRATAVKAATIMDTINKYAQFEQESMGQDLQALLSAFDIAGRTKRREDRTGSVAGTTSSSSTQTGGGKGFGIAEGKELGGAIGTITGAVSEFTSGRGGNKYGFTPGFSDYGQGDIPD